MGMFAFRLAAEEAAARAAAAAENDAQERPERIVKAAETKSRKPAAKMDAADKAAQED